jgi:hypothetical protein
LCIQQSPTGAVTVPANPLEHAAELLRIALTETCEKVELGLSQDEDVIRLRITVALRRDRVDRTSVHPIDIGPESTEASRRSSIHAALVDLQGAIEMVLGLG